MYKIVKYPDHLLRTKLPILTDFSDKVKLENIIKIMTMTMQSSKGIGIAANQVGLIIRLAIISNNGASGSEIAIFNPEIIDRHGRDSMTEGCLSYPHVRGTIRRHSGIKLKYQDVDGKQCELEADGMLAKIIQHEVDHLNGLTIYDRMHQVDKAINKKAIKALVTEYQNSY